MTEQRRAGLALLGEFVAFAHRPQEPRWVISVDANGMVEVFGLDGRFAPHLFVPWTPAAPQSYALVPGAGGEAGIHCLRCGMTSYNPNDLAMKYCGKCHAFHTGAT